MKIVLWLVAALVFVPVAYMGFDLAQELNGRVAERNLRDAEVRSGVMRLLKTHEQYSFHQIVIGPGETETQREFRARATLADVTQPAYGVLDSTCGEPAGGNLGCWELAALYIDGILVDDINGSPAKNAGTALAEAKIPADPPPTAVNAEVPSLSDQTAPVEAAVEDTVEISALQPVAPPPEATASHIVRFRRINARVAPSLQDKIKAKLLKGTQLLLLEEGDGWGRFRVLDGENRDLEAWISFSVLSPR